jgi:hypothetical protein
MLTTDHIIMMPARPHDVVWLTPGLLLDVVVRCGQVAALHYALLELSTKVHGVANSAGGTTAAMYKLYRTTDNVYIEKHELSVLSGCFRRHSALHSPGIH